MGNLRKKHKVFMLAAVVALLLSLVPLAVLAQSEAPVSATVTVAFVAVTVNLVDVDYGILKLGDLDKLPDPSATAFDITNDGNVSGDFSIVGADSTGDGWTLITSEDGVTRPAADEYAHRYSTGSLTGDTFGGVTLEGVSPVVTLAANVIQDIYLQMDMPESLTTPAAGVAESLPITVSVVMT